MLIIKQDDRAVIVAPAPDWMGSMEELAALASQGRPWRVITQADIPDAAPDQWLWSDQGLLGVGDLPNMRAIFRASASLPKSDFCVALWQAGILTEEQAIEGAGGIWPAPFEPVIAGLPTLDRVRLKADFRAITHIRRAHPLMDGLGAAAGLTPEQIDTLFGWQDV